MTKTFVLFRDGRRLRAAHLSIPAPGVPLWIVERRFRPTGSLAHWSHITDQRNQLIGFVVNRLLDASRFPFWRAWWDSFENRTLDDFEEAYIFLTEAIPADWHHDCALLVGPALYSDGDEEFAIVIPDENGTPAKFWTEIGFQPAPQDLIKTR